jgi:hypothetical protein
MDAICHKERLTYMMAPKDNVQNQEFLSHHHLKKQRQNMNMCFSKIIKSPCNGLEVNDCNALMLGLLIA